jgi:iron complex outermembrane receptor protein
MKKRSRVFSRLAVRKPHQRVAFFAAAVATALSSAAADTDTPAATQPRTDVMEMDLEVLMKMEVTSVSRKSERLSDAAAAIFVITQEDIRRSGATSIPEALRLSPGLEVARQDAHTWAISSRGFNDEFANQLLVLVDGRSVYTPLFAGVYWDVQDLPLEDIDRIEVIRGPGATLWGANAVNGVINITTKSAKDTQGLLITGGGGTEDRAFGTVQYGGKIGENAYYRVYGKYFDRDSSALRDGSDAHDSWSMSRGGFRLDWLPNDQNTFTLQGDYYGGELGQAVTVPAINSPQAMYLRTLTDEVNTSGGNILARWTHSFSDHSELAVKLYYDHTDRDRVVFAEKRDTFDADLQHHFQLGERHDFVWGLGFNSTSDQLKNSDAIIFDPTHRTVSLYSAFVQDEIALIQDRLKLTLGTKIEHNDYTGFEIQPSGRLSLKITDKQTAWFAASRAVSTPSRAEEDIQINRFVIPPGAPSNPTPLPVLVSLFGSHNIESKELVAFELGYRIQPHPRVSLDAATFYNVYDKQRSIEADAPDLSHLPNYIVAPYTINNLIDGETYGVELSATWQATDWWRLRANYTFWRLALHKDPTSTDPFLEQAEDDSPRHQIGVRSLMDLPHHIEFDTGLRYVDTLSQRRRFVDPLNPAIPSYVVGDVRIGWRPNYHWEFSVAAQNLFQTRHQEFAPSYIQTQETRVETSVYGKITYRF